MIFSTSNISGLVWFYGEDFNIKKEGDDVIVDDKYIISVFENSFEIRCISSNSNMNFTIYCDHIETDEAGEVLDLYLTNSREETVGIISILDVWTDILGGKLNVRNDV